ncbi:MAG: (2Fe-2S)-binding protein [Candidatus Marinimicrobia bacterium]|jgi:carbon-monoxide dehydrogenase small subunit|nr:(2Fe-2S)-binding protein [Candidatus Neomarinimicrobiota bacterium]|tara:strand:- start:98 stop:571 length:474 start_codon:yes stop_codon:yes gene_type:complete
MANSTHTIKVNVNGQTVSADISSELRLLDFLRYELDLTGAKEVCGEGECGACTVVLDGITVNSCLVLAVEVDGAEITTIEGLSKNGSLNEMQNAFVEHHSVQCGYCIPGMVLSGEQIIKDHEQPLRDTIKEDLSGNICRCTGYQKIVDAIETVANQS